MGATCCCIWAKSARCVLCSSACLCTACMGATCCCTWAASSCPRCFSCCCWWFSLISATWLLILSRDISAAPSSLRSSSSPSSSCSSSPSWSSCSPGLSATWPACTTWSFFCWSPCSPGRSATWSVCMLRPSVCPPFITGLPACILSASLYWFTTGSPSCLSLTSSSPRCLWSLSPAATVSCLR